MDRSRPLDLRRNDTAVGSRLCPPVHATAYNYRAPPRAFSSFHPLTYKRQQPVSNPSRRSSRILFLSSRTCAAPLPPRHGSPPSSSRRHLWLLFFLCVMPHPRSSFHRLMLLPQGRRLSIRRLTWRIKTADLSLLSSPVRRSNETGAGESRSRGKQQQGAGSR